MFSNLSDDILEQMFHAICREREKRVEEKMARQHYPALGLDECNLVRGGKKFDAIVMYSRRTHLSVLVAKKMMDQFARKDQEEREVYDKNNQAFLQMCRDELG